MPWTSAVSNVTFPFDCHYDSFPLFYATVHLPQGSSLKTIITMQYVRDIIRPSIHNGVSFGADVSYETERNSKYFVKTSVLSKQTQTCRHWQKHLGVTPRRNSKIYCAEAFYFYFFSFRKRSQPLSDAQWQQCAMCVTPSCSPAAPSLSPPAGVETAPPSCAWASRSSPCRADRGGQQEVGEARGGREPTASPTLWTHWWALPRQTQTSHVVKLSKHWFFFFFYI